MSRIRFGAPIESAIAFDIAVEILEHLVLQRFASTTRMQARQMQPANPPLLASGLRNRYRMLSRANL